MEIDRLSEEFEHEQLSVFHDSETGVTGAIAIHSTVLGPAMGGLRLATYPTLGAGLVDALRLARAMSFKNAAAGLDLGGGKAILLDDGEWAERREERMRAVGAAIERLGGRYVTAEDVGTTPADMDTIAMATDHVAGRAIDRGGRGDPSPYTARTVLAAIRSAVRLRIGARGLEGIRIGVEGVGHVGGELVLLLREAGARVYVADLDADKAMTVADSFGATALPLENFAEGDFDVFAPCALGGAIDAGTLDRLRAPVVAGAANNPLADRRLASGLRDRGILYVPDFLANCGGIIQVGAEVLGLGEGQVEALITDAVERTDAVLEEALAEGTVPMDLAEARAAQVLRSRSPVRTSQGPASVAATR
jgi:glutamate dehydrogenase/leucine dehydrogenase